MTQAGCDGRNASSETSPEKLDEHHMTQAGCDGRDASSETSPEKLDEHYMTQARRAGRKALLWASPNPAVGAVVVTEQGVFEGRTSPPGGPHAERSALEAAGGAARGSTLYTTLEPCPGWGRTPPCVEAILRSEVRRVVVGIEDPDPGVSGAGMAALSEAGVDITLGVCAAGVAEDLAAYLTHRRSGRPFVILKLAATLDGRIAAPDGSSRWITGAEARADVHRLRAYSDAVLVGAGTARIDDPSLSVRDFSPPDGVSLGDVQPIRVVLGSAPPTARMQPALEVSGDLPEVLSDLGKQGIQQLLVEGGAEVAGAFHRAGLVDRYVFYLAPKLAGGGGGAPPLSGECPPSVSDFWSGKITEVLELGGDLRVTLLPA